MKLRPFTIITHNSAQQTEEQIKLLINIDHIVSIKPIKMTTQTREVVDAHWIRLSNGKKYRAVQIPSIIMDCFNEDLSLISKSDEAEVSNSIQ